MGNSAKIYSATVYAGGACLIHALAKRLNGANLEPEDLVSIRYSVHKLGQTAMSQYEAVAGHNNVELDISKVFFTAESRTYNGTAVLTNFEWLIDTSEHDAFPTRNAYYEIRIDFEASDEFVSPIVYQVKAV